MRVAIHQPNYFPWLGYFLKIQLADVFVFHDTVSISRQSYVKRVRINKESAGKASRWLSVPVQHHSSKDAIATLKADQDRDWRMQHLRFIDAAYRQTKHFDEAFPFLESALTATNHIQPVADINIALIQRLCKMIGCKRRWVRSSDLQRPESGSALNAEIVREVGGDTYLAGKGSMGYHNAEDFATRNLAVRFVDSSHFLQQQLSGLSKDLATDRSIIDALMHIGWQGVRDVLQNAGQAFRESEVGSAE